MTRRFEFIGYGSDKFWEIHDEQYRGPTNDYEVKVYWGRRGTNGQYQGRIFKKKLEAKNFIAEKISEKVRKGYKEIGAVMPKVLDGGTAKVMADAFNKMGGFETGPPLTPVQEANYGKVNVGKMNEAWNILSSYDPAKGLTQAQEQAVQILADRSGLEGFLSAAVKANKKKPAKPEPEPERLIGLDD